MTRKIAIGYDATENGEDALALGGLLAEVLDAKPLICMVVQVPDHLLESPDLELQVKEETAQRLGAAAGSLAGQDVETRALPGGSPARLLDELVEQDQPLALVLGSSHRGVVGRTMIGGVGESLLGGAGCAIAVAPHGFATREERRLHRIGVAYNGSPESRGALRAAISLAERLHGTLTLLAVAEPPRYGYGAAFTALSAGDFVTAEERAKDRLLEDAAAGLPAEVPVERRRLSGEPAPALADAGSDLDLLVAGSRGYGMMKRVLLGGVSAKLMRAASCPVLILPRGAGEDPLDLVDADV